MKKSLILLHGALGSSKQMDPLKEKLQESYEVYSFNFEGHGERSIHGTYSIDCFVENVLNFMAENSLQKASFFGYSMGGYVALKLAAQHPEKVKSIVTLGTKFNWNPESAAAEVKMLNPEVIEAKIPKFAEQLKTTHSTLDWKEVLKGTAEMMINLGAGAGLSDNEIRSIQNPVLVGIGDLDQMVSIDESKRVADLLPNASLKIYEGFPHPIDRVDVSILSKEIQIF